jgi:hypothetical protein
MNERRDGHTDPDPEEEHRPQSLEAELMSLAEELGYRESDRARALREQLRSGLTDEQSFRLIAEYQNQLREDTPPDQDPAVGDIIMAVNILGVGAMIRCGRFDDARDALSDAIALAEQQGQQDLADYLNDLGYDIPVT